MNIYSVVTYFYIINSHYLDRIYLLKQRPNRYFILSNPIHGISDWKLNPLSL